MTPDETNGPPNRAEHPQQPAEGDRHEVESALAQDEDAEPATPPSEGSDGGDASEET